MLFLWLLFLFGSITSLSIYLRYRYGCTLIGLTGGIATGKSTCSRHLHSLNAYIIDFDVIARVVVEPGRYAYNKIVAKFGREILAPDQTIDRQKLGQIVFNDRSQLRALSSITKLPIMWEFTKQAVRGFYSGHRIIILDAPLLFEAHLQYVCTSTVLIYVDRDVQIQRLQQRDNINRTLAESKINAQWSLDKKKKMADVVIDNTSTADALRSSVTSWYEGVLRADSRQSFSLPTIPSIMISTVTVLPIWLCLMLSSR